MWRKATQKEIAAPYQDNLDHYKKVHPLRRARFLVSFFALALGLAAILAFQRRCSEKFFNPGPLSANHAALVNQCSSCHEDSLRDDRRPRPIPVSQTFHDRVQHGEALEPIDKNCEACHFARDKRIYDFHEPDVIANRSCSDCHQEHRGPERMAAVTSAQCATCHNNRLTMSTSAQKSRTLDWRNFQRHPAAWRQVELNLSHPPNGYTQTFAAFWEGHPEFQLKREPVRDPDVLKFNHQRHFAADVPPVNGKKLDCNFCHEPDLQGRFNQRLTFVGQCQPCHSLQFDPKNRELVLPHGNTTAVRGFLRALPSHYADLAVKKTPKASPNEIKNFVTQQMLQLRDRVRSGESFEQEIFFTVDPYKLTPGNNARVRASFYGCALCHDVQPVANAAPFIAKPTTIDRWMPQANFNHAKHTMVKCDECHHAIQSRLTSDVLMPGIASCVVCHSPQGRVVAECTTCHSYHVPAMFSAGGKILPNGLSGQPSPAKAWGTATAAAWSAVAARGRSP